MKILTDFFPVIIFFLVYRLYDIYIATAIAIIASILQVGYYDLYRGRQIQGMHLATLGVIVVFGGLTLILQDRTFIMLKPSIINWIFAIVFFGSQFWGRQTIAERMMGHAITVPAKIWIRLNWLWVGFFIIIGAANLYVANWFFIAEAKLKAVTKLIEIDLTSCAKLFNGDTLILCNIARAQEELWVDFKLFGVLGLTFAFAIAQAFYLARYIKEPENT